jgi:predicted ATPase
MRPSQAWYVITGGPSTGKTTTVTALTQRGYHVVEEAARLVIEERRRVLEALRTNSLR